MAVTPLFDDPSADLPYWARQPGGPTGTPSATPQGVEAGGGPQPPPGVDPMAWLAYLQRFFVSPAAAAEAPKPPLPGPMTGPAGPVGNLPTAAPPAPPAPPMPARPAGVSATGLPLQPGSESPASLSYFPSGGNPAPTGSSLGPNAPAAAGAAAPVPGPMAANPRFIGIDRPNAPAEASGLQGRNSGLQGTALNLAGLFGRQQPQAAPAANVVAPGPMAARPDLAQRVPLANTPTPPIMPPDIAAARAAADPRTARARILQPRYYT
jgi:hypothetical protein